MVLLKNRKSEVGGGGDNWWHLKLVTHSWWCQTRSWITLLGILHSRSAAECKTAATGKVFFFPSTVLLRCPLLYKTCWYSVPLFHLDSERSGRRIGASTRTFRFGEWSLSSDLSTQIKQYSHLGFPSSGVEGKGSCALVFSVDRFMAFKPERFALTACWLCLIQAQHW